MKLLIISNDYPNAKNENAGGNFIKEQVNCLKKKFETIFIISPTFYGVEYIREVKYSNYEYDNVKVFYPKYFNFPFCFFICRKLWVYFEKDTIIRTIKKNNISFDLLHAHFTWPSGTVATELKDNYQAPVIITEHSSFTFSKAVSCLDSLMIQTWEKADAIIRVRPGDCMQFSKVKIPMNKIYFIPNGFNSKLFFPSEKIDARNKLKLPPEKKILLNVANFYSEVKGHHFFIAAMKEIIEYRKDVLAIIVGSGILRDTLQKQINDAGLQEFVLLVGGKPHDEIPVWINATDLFIMPSIMESFGIVQIEALACGKPVIATINGGSEDLITSEKYGFLCEPKNAHALAQNILRGLNHQWDVKEILEYAKQFDIELVCERIFDVYKRTSEK